MAYKSINDLKFCVNVFPKFLKHCKCHTWAHQLPKTKNPASHLEAKRTSNLARRSLSYCFESSQSLMHFLEGLKH